MEYVLSPAYVDTCSALVVCYIDMQGTKVLEAKVSESVIPKLMVEDMFL